MFLEARRAEKWLQDHFRGLHQYLETGLGRPVQFRRWDLAPIRVRDWGPGWPARGGDVDPDDCQARFS